MAKSLLGMHKKLLAEANQFLPSRSSRVPVVAHAPAQVIVPQDRWQLIDFVNGEKALRKTYRFFSVSNRNTFLNELFESDNDVVRSREVKVNKLSVDVILGTPHLGVPTEIDKEFAKFLDDLYRDVSFDANV